MFAATHSFGFFDYFRVPYAIGAGNAAQSAPVGQLRLAAQGSHHDRSGLQLFWLRRDIRTRARPGRYQLDGFTFFGQVAPDAAVPGILAGLGHDWRPVTPIRDQAGRVVAATWQDSRRNVFLPFDPAEIMHQFWSEGYQQAGRSALATAGRAAILRGYYLARPALPRPLQLRLRRAFTAAQDRSSFPAWPLETSLHDFYAWMFELIAGLAGTAVPFLDIWPGSRSWALVLTHDVDTAAGQEQVELLRDIERARGLVSSWNFVGERYQVDEVLLRKLQREGCEVGVHGLRHDGRDLASRRLMEQRLPAMRQYADQWNAAGFRSPATQRHWDLMPRLGFQYDSSYSDTDPYEPQPGGSCTYLPYFNQDMVELPITMPQDHTLYAILQQSDAGTWLRKARALRERGGMALMLTHPDYAGDPRVRDSYAALLDAFCDDATAWHALPREVADWWRCRDASVIRRGHRLEVEGPAAGRAAVRFATTERPQRVADVPELAVPGAAS